MPRKETVAPASRKGHSLARKPAAPVEPKAKRRSKRRPSSDASRNEPRSLRHVARRTSPWLEPALEAALEAISRPAFVMDPVGNVVLANTKGHERVSAEDPDSLLDAMRVAQRGEPSPFDVTPLRGDAEGYVLAVEREGPSSLKELVIKVAHRYELTRAQVRVLTLIADGLQNWAIARELGISERTVEAHVTGILDRIGVETRAAAVAVVLALDPSRS